MTRKMNILAEIGRLLIEFEIERQRKQAAAEQAAKQVSAAAKDEGDALTSPTKEAYHKRGNVQGEKDGSQGSNQLAQHNRLLTARKCLKSSNKLAKPGSDWRSLKKEHSDE